VTLRPQAPTGERYRFNWNTPIELSPHNPRIVYIGGNKLFRSLNKGAFTQRDWSVRWDGLIRYWIGIMLQIVL
jgi:hypothetical protein